MMQNEIQPPRDDNASEVEDRIHSAARGKEYGITGMAESR